MPVSKTERLLNLLAFLLNTPQPVTLAEITEKVEGYRGARAKASATRCFERDKAELSAMGISIDYVSGDSFNPAAYFLDRSRYFMPVISMTEDERLLLAVAVRLARSQGSNECSDHLFWAIQKLVFDRPYLGQSGPEPKEPPVEEKSDARRLSLLYTLARAAALRSPVTFVYFGIGSNRARRRKVHPYGLATYRGAWYLSGVCAETEGIRTFKVNRIQGAVRVGKADSFEIPADFRVGNHIGPGAWSSSERGRREEVTVAFSPTVAWMVARELEDCRSWTLDDGWVAFRFSSYDRGMLFRWLLGLSPFVRVMAPADFSEEFKSCLARIAAAYEKNT